MAETSASFGSVGEPAVLRETHTGVVVLSGEHAYKVKKPVRLPFLDLSTPEERWRTCRREVELNRRLAPDVYLDIATFDRTSTGVHEPVIVMRRMPEDRRLATLVTWGMDVDDELRALARLIAGFHANADRRPEIAHEGGPARLWHRWRLNLTEAQRFSPVVLDPQQLAETTRLAGRYVRGRVPLLRERADEGCTVDGHGDLLAEDIFCLPDHPRVLDCLEFDDTLRWVDQLDDVAFLAMDLEALGRPDLAARFLDDYREFSAVPWVVSLVHHYMAYRAFVRAKVAAIRAAQGSTSAAVRARDHSALAVRHLRAGEVRLVLVGGPPGTGKTTVAGAVADQLGYVALASDRLRRETVPAQGRYSDAAKDAVYLELLARARRALEHGESVVVDATWGAQRWRDAAARVAAETYSRLVPLECTAPIEVAAARVQQRFAGRCSDSEADVHVARLVRAQWAPWPEATRIDTARTLHAVTRDACAVVAPEAATPTASEPTAGTASTGSTS